MRGNRCTSSACDALAAEQCNATPHRAIPTYPVQYPRATSTIKNPDSTASVEDTGGSRESSCGARGRRRGLAVVRTDTQPRKCRRCGGRRRVRRAWAGFEIDHSERSSRVAISRAAGPDGARNTSGATSNNEQRRAKLTARTTLGRAAAHGCTKQPGSNTHEAAPRTPAVLQVTSARHAETPPRRCGMGQPTQSGGKV